jgi:hypothetical protein
MLACCPYAGVLPLRTVVRTRFAAAEEEQEKHSFVANTLAKPCTASKGERQIKIAPLRSTAVCLFIPAIFLSSLPFPPELSLFF